jgi:hypothetical protein
LNRISHKLGIEELADVGKPIDSDITYTIDVPVVTYGELPGSEISELLSDSIGGVIDYPAAMLGKSTIFAAYCSHRLIPIVALYGDAQSAEGLEVGSQYWPTNVATERLTLNDGQRVADNALEWYQKHRLSVHADRLAVCLGLEGRQQSVA